jgi:hypothetical protein
MKMGMTLPKTGTILLTDCIHSISSTGSKHMAASSQHSATNVEQRVLSNTCVTKLKR